LAYYVSRCSECRVAGNISKPKRERERESNRRLEKTA
jgi:hypothetical protein